MKPSERTPMACLALVELLQESGMPPGVVNVIHGQHDAVNFICDHPDARAISLVGGDTAGRHIFHCGSVKGKMYNQIWVPKIMELFCLMPTEITQ